MSDEERDAGMITIDRGRERVASDAHRVTVKFDLDGDALGMRTHGQVEHELEAIVAWGLQACGYRPSDVTGLRAKVRDA